MTDYSAMSDPAMNPMFRRRWTEPPHREGFKSIGEVVDIVVDDMAAHAVHHWLAQADQHDGEDRVVCLETADAILRTAGLRWGDIFPRRAA